MVAGRLRDKRGYFHIVITYKDFNGKKREKWISTGLSVKNNKRKAEELLLEARRNFVPPEEPTQETYISAFLIEWLDGIRTNIEVATYVSYKIYIGKINEYFEEKKVSLINLEAKHIQNYYTYLLNEKNLSPNTIVHYHAILHKALKYAVRMDIITKNPMEKVDCPKVPKFTGSFYDIQEINKLLEVVKDTKIEFAVMTAVFYGLRRSEIVGLKWKAVDFQNKTLTINHTVIQTTVDGQYQLIQKDRTKNKSSMRSLPLITEFEQYLLGMKEKQLEFKKLCGKCYNYDYEEYIYVDEMGTLVKPNYITQNFSAVLAKNNLRMIRFHDLRHSCASIMLAKGISIKAIQSWLGHSDFSTTANIYAHLESKEKENSANIMRDSGIHFNNTKKSRGTSMGH